MFKIIITALFALIFSFFAKILSSNLDLIYLVGSDFIYSSVDYVIATLIVFSIFSLILTIIYMVKFFKNRNNKELKSIE